MSKKNHGSKASQQKSGQKLIASNPTAKSNYAIEAKVEAGLVLTGTEVKSLRAQSPNIKDSYVDIRSQGTQLEAWLMQAHIAPYSHGNIWNHDPDRPRKILLHKKELQKLFGAKSQKGISVVPLRMYFLKGRAKVELGLGKGKKQHDKREDIKRRSTEREMRQAMKRDR